MPGSRQVGVQHIFLKRSLGGALEKEKVLLRPFSSSDTFHICAVKCLNSDNRFSLFSLTQVGGILGPPSLHPLSQVSSLGGSDSSSKTAHHGPGTAGRSGKPGQDCTPWSPPQEQKGAKKRLFWPLGTSCTWDAPLCAGRGGGREMLVAVSLGTKWLLRCELLKTCLVCKFWFQVGPFCEQGPLPCAPPPRPRFPGCSDRSQDLFW